MKKTVVFIYVPSHCIQYELFIYFFSGTVIKTLEIFIFLDITKMPFCLDGAGLAFQDPFITLDIRMGFFL